VTEENNYWWGNADLSRPKKEPDSVQTVYSGWTNGTPVVTGGTTEQYFIVFDSVYWGSKGHTQGGNEQSVQTIGPGGAQYYVIPKKTKPSKPKYQTKWWNDYSREARRDQQFFRRTRFEGWDNVPKQSIRACSCKGRPSRNYRPRS
jgi:hypothetical protein